jgi:hypothetical protein
MQSHPPRCEKRGRGLLVHCTARPRLYTPRDSLLTFQVDRFVLLGRAHRDQPPTRTPTRPDDLRQQQREPRRHAQTGTNRLQDSRSFRRRLQDLGGYNRFGRRVRLDQGLDVQVGHLRPPGDSEGAWRRRSGL